MKKKADRRRKCGWNKKTAADIERQPKERESIKKGEEGRNGQETDSTLPSEEIGIRTLDRAGEEICGTSS